jgi:predicted DNA binding CopG/RHH family protein
MSKKINIAMPKENIEKIEKWIKDGNDEEKIVKNQNISIKMKRLTIDISENLHSQIKVYCAKKGINMADEIRRLLEKNFI